MRGTVLLVLVVAALPVLLSCPDGADAADYDLGSKIAGVWLGQYEIEGPDSIRSAFITTYHPDGTAATTSALALGAGDPTRFGLSTTHHIQWEPTGDREIRWRLLHFGHEPDGSLRYLSRTYGSLTFDEHFESAEGPLQIEVHAPATLLRPLDPNRDEVEPIFSARGKSMVRRLHTRIAGDDELTE